MARRGQLETGEVGTMVLGSRGNAMYVSTHLRFTATNIARRSASSREQFSSDVVASKVTVAISYSLSQILYCSSHQTLSHLLNSDCGD